MPNKSSKKRIQKQTDRSIFDEKCLNRLNLIHKLIKEGTVSGNYPSFSYILDTLSQNKETEIKRATLFKDLALLSASKVEGGFGAPIKNDRIKHGYYYTEPNYEFIIDSGSFDKLYSLFTAKKLLASLSNTPVYKNISEITNFITGKSNIIERIAIAPYPHSTIESKKWEKLSESLSKNIKLKILLKNYTLKKPTITPILFSPYQLIFSEEKYYLYGKAEIIVPKGKIVKFFDFTMLYFLFGDKDPEKKWEKEIILDLSQFDTIELTDYSFNIPDNIDLTKPNITSYVGYIKGNFEDCFKEKIKSVDPNTYNAIIAEEKYQNQYGITDGKIQIKLYKKARELVENCIFSEDKKVIEENEDYIILEFTPNFPDVLRWILSYGSNIEPIKPKELVKIWKDEIFRLYEHVNEKDRESFEIDIKRAEEIKQSPLPNNSTF